MNELAKTQTTTPTTSMAKVGPAELLMVAVNKDLDIDKLQKLMDMQTEWEAKESRKAFFKAMAKFQGLCPVIKKKKKGHNYQYAPIGDIQTQVKSIITKCGLSYRFQQSWDAEILTLSCIVSHLDGHSETVTMVAEVDNTGSKNSIQGRASSVTYLTRYTFVGSFGIATADEDMDGRLPEEFQEPKPDNFPQERFDQNFKAWSESIKEGKTTVEGLISKLITVAPLTSAQEHQIRNIK